MLIKKYCQHYHPSTADDGSNIRNCQDYSINKTNPRSAVLTLTGRSDKRHTFCKAVVERDDNPSSYSFHSFLQNLGSANGYEIGRFGYAYNYFDEGNFGYVFYM